MQDAHTDLVDKIYDVINRNIYVEIITDAHGNKWEKFVMTPAAIKTVVISTLVVGFTIFLWVI